MNEVNENKHERPHSSRPVPAWAEKYPEHFRGFLIRRGVDDHDEPALVAYNKDLISVVERCAGQSDEVFRQQYAQTVGAWINVLRRFQPQVDPQREREGAYLYWETPWLLHPLDEDHKLFRSDKAVEQLAERTGIAFTDSGFAWMRDLGRGPYLVTGGFPYLPRLARWAAFTFEIPPEGPRLSEIGEAPPQVAEPHAAPRWLLASEDRAETGQMRAMLEDLGAEVVRAESELQAAQLVSHSKIDGMVLRINGRIDAELTISYICMSRGIPYVLITNGAERPQAMGVGGVVLHNPRSPHEVLSAIHRLPASRLKGLNLPAAYET